MPNPQKNKSLFSVFICKCYKYILFLNIEFNNMDTDDSAQIISEGTSLKSIKRKIHSKRLIKTDANNKEQKLPFIVKLLIASIVIILIINIFQVVLLYRDIRKLKNPLKMRTIILIYIKKKKSQ